MAKRASVQAHGSRSRKTAKRRALKWARLQAKREKKARKGKR